MHHHKRRAQASDRVDFAKAYDSVRWDYLLEVLEAFGFGRTWCNWIRGTLTSAKASILINGSPSKEYSCHRGLKQGDPLAPYLFILIMESLHLSFNRVVRACSKGVIEEHLLADLTSLMDSRLYRIQVIDAAQTTWTNTSLLRLTSFAWRARQDCLPTRVNSDLAEASLLKSLLSRFVSDGELQILMTGLIVIQESAVLGFLSIQFPPMSQSYLKGVFYRIFGVIFVLSIGVKVVVIRQALREILEEQTRAEKEREERIKKEQDEDELFRVQKMAEAESELTLPEKDVDYFDADFYYSLVDQRLDVF
ncbi:RNA-directed DNA polymerase, eukaryota [Tanacetum coccineum]